MVYALDFSDFSRFLSVRKCVSKFLDSTLGNILKHHTNVFINGGSRQLSRRAADETLNVKIYWEKKTKKNTLTTCVGCYKKGYKIAAAPYSASFTTWFNPHLLIGLKLSPHPNESIDSHVYFQPSSINILGLSWWSVTCDVAAHCLLFICWSLSLYKLREN